MPKDWNFQAPSKRTIFAISIEVEKNKKGRTSDKEVLPMLLSGCPDRTIFATFV
jgi:hypothetical protein